LSKSNKQIGIYRILSKKQQQQKQEAKQNAEKKKKKISKCLQSKIAVIGKKLFVKPKNFLRKINDS
jgi:hypothetical protein